MIALFDTEARERLHNPWHCNVCRKLVNISYGIYIDKNSGTERCISFCRSCNHVNVVENHKWEIPEDFKDRTGRPWADSFPVYMKVNKNDWRVLAYREAKFIAECCKRDGVFYRIYCANSDAGIPKRENW
jgi:hypothetical protein